MFPGGRPFRNGMSVNPEHPDHPALAGIDRDRLFLWDDFTSWNETKPGFPQVYPVTRGFVLADPATFGKATSFVPEPVKVPWPESFVVA